ncbi:MULTISPECIES: hypothetical protein [Rubritalea]|nr:hypothetical protein [Rubritalea squalenifaciens]
MSEQTPPSPPVTPSPQAENTPPAKGMSTGAKVGIGCGAAALVCVVIAAIGIWIVVVKVRKFIENPQKTAAELVIKNIPDLEAAEFNDEDHTVTVVYKKDGKSYTLDYKDAAKGQIVLKDSDGNVITLGSNDTSKIPGWVPQPDGLSNMRVFFVDKNDEVTKGQYTATLSGSAESAFEQLNSQLGDQDYSTNRHHVSAEGSGQWNLTGTKDNREVTILIYSTKGDNGITVIWNQK